MFLSYFTEQPYPFPDEEALRHFPGDHPARKLGDVNLLFSNRFFDPELARDLYADRIAEYRLAEEVGFDGIYLKEHHNVPWCLQASTNVMAAFVAASTTRIRMLQSGHLLPIWENPVQLAEEIAMIDLLSGGRIVPGIFRGPGTDSLATNTNPAHNRERFVEAHDLLIRTWTEPGPFRWEGNHYQFRVVNPWVLPLQKPHPRIMVLARGGSPATVEFAAAHGYPLLCINSTTEQNASLRAQYDAAAERSGFAAGPEHRNYNLRIAVAETESEALRLGRHFIQNKDASHQWGNPLWATPTGHSTPEEIRRRRELKAPRYASVEEQVRNGTQFAGTPEQVIEQIGTWLDKNRAGMLTFWAQEGTMSHAEAVGNITLLGEAVLPAIRQIGEELKCFSPFELDSPVNLTLEPTGAARDGGDPRIHRL